MVSTLFYGERIRLTALRPDDARLFAEWYENGEFARLFDSAPAMPKSDRDMEKYIEEAMRERNRYSFAIRLHYSDDLIGIIELDSVQWAHGSAWLAIGIGNQAHRGKGYGLESMQLAIKFAFHELNLHRLQLTVFGYNEAAIKLYEKLGFTKEGTFREALHRDGGRFDMHLYGLLSTEWGKKPSPPAPPTAIDATPNPK